MRINDLSYFMVVTDGGCLGNGGSNPQCYGSYAVIAVEGCLHEEEIGKHVSRTPYSHLHTNNEAEYQAVQDACVYMADLFARMGKQYPVTICTDSRLVVEQLDGTMKCKTGNLPKMRAATRLLVDSIHATVREANRDYIVEVLGH